MIRIGKGGGRGLDRFQRLKKPGNSRATVLVGEMELLKAA